MNILIEDNKDIDNLIQKINGKVIEVKKLNRLNGEFKKKVEDFYKKYINYWLENHYISNIELPKENNEIFINALLDFYNSLNEVINEKLEENYEDRLGKNLAKKKYFINQAIQNKISQLPPGTPPRTDKQFVQNIEYYQQLTQQSRFSPRTKEFIDGVINNIKQNRGLASPKQLTILQKLKLGQLQESRISDLKPQLVGKSIDEDEFNKIVSIKVPKPIYTEWLLINYIKEFKSQNKSIDDFLKLDPSNVIEFFEKNKNLFDSKDITSYSFNSLNKKVMDINTEVGPASALSTLDLDKLSKAGIKNLGEINGYQIIKIPKGNNSPQAWQAYKNIICQGRTRVCTASNYSRFEYYTTNDNLFLIVSPEDEKSPYHVAKFNGEIKDKDDQKITDPKIWNIINKL